MFGSSFKSYEVESSTLNMLFFSGTWCLHHKCQQLIGRTPQLIWESMRNITFLDLRKNGVRINGLNLNVCSFLQNVNVGVSFFFHTDKKLQMKVQMIESIFNGWRYFFHIHYVHTSMFCSLMFIVSVVLIVICIKIYVLTDLCKHCSMLYFFSSFL